MSNYFVLQNITSELLQKLTDIIFEKQKNLEEPNLEEIYKLMKDIPLSTNISNILNTKIKNTQIMNNVKTLEQKQFIIDCILTILTLLFYKNFEELYINSNNKTITLDIYLNNQLQCFKLMIDKQIT